MNAIRIVRRLEEAVVGTLIGVILLAIIAQVVSRYVFGSPLTWAESLAKFAAIWAIFLGAAVGASRRAHIAVDVLPSALPPGVQRILRIGLEVVTIAILVVLIKAGIDMTKMSMTSILPGIPLPLAAIYMPVPFTAGLMIIEALLHIRALVLGSTDGADGAPDVAAA